MIQAPAASQGVCCRPARQSKYIKRAAWVSLSDRGVAELIGQHTVRGQQAKQLAPDDNQHDAGAAKEFAQG